MDFFEEIYEEFERAEKSYHEPTDEQNPFQGKYSAKEILNGCLEKIEQQSEKRRGLKTYKNLL